MAVPLRLTRLARAYAQPKQLLFVKKTHITNPVVLRKFATEKISWLGEGRNKFNRTFLVASAALSGIYVAFCMYYSDEVDAAYDQDPKHKALRKIRNANDKSGLKLTLYQVQSCPFCTKVRTYLDFMGLSYDVVEVKGFRRKELQWSTYKKVPLLLVHGQGQDGFVQLNDSAAIISVLESYLKTSQGYSMEQLASFFPRQDSVDKNNKPVVSYPTRYNIIYGERAEDFESEKTNKQQKEEKKWRRWTDEWLVHTLSPNIYRTSKEARQTFRMFDEVGEWHKVYTWPSRQFIIYAGAAAMGYVGKSLGKKWSLKEDVRLDLYEACDKWIAAVNTEDRTFMGGEKPNLADLSVFGCMHAIDGTQAFSDALEHTKIGPWYEATKRAVQANAGVKVK